MGAWIETADKGLEVALYRMSLPTWGRGLKLLPIAIRYHILDVAPYMGAWIETPRYLSTMPTKRVAPYMGAWIETLHCTRYALVVQSLPTWGRGLKLHPCL